MSTQLSRVIGIVVVLVAVVFGVGEVRGLTVFDSNWDDGGDQLLWNDAYNWAPDSTPKNVKNAVEYNVTIGDNETVEFRGHEPYPGGTLGYVEVNGFNLGIDATLRLKTDDVTISGLTVSRPASEGGTVHDAVIAGLIQTYGVDFTADIAGQTSFEGDRARIHAYEGAVVEIAATMFDCKGWWRSWDAGSGSDDDVGTWYPELLKSTGAGSMLDLSSVIEIDAGFSSSGNDHSRQQIEALAGGTINLSSVDIINAPQLWRDSLEIISDGTDSSIDLSSLSTIAATYHGQANSHGYVGTFKVVVSNGGSMDLSNLSAMDRTVMGVSGGSTLTMPKLMTVVDSTFAVSGGSELIATGGSATYSSKGLWDSWDAGSGSDDDVGTWYPELLKSTGAESMLDLSSVIEIDAGFNSNGNDRTRQRIYALDGGAIDLSNVDKITTAQSWRDSLELRSVGEGSSINLESLVTIDALYHGQANIHDYLGTAKVVVSNGGSMDLSNLSAMDRTVMGVSGGSTLTMPKLMTVVDSTFAVSGGSELIATGGSATYSSKGLWDSWDAGSGSDDDVGTWYPELLKSTGAESLLDLFSVTEIDAGFSSSGNDHTYQRIQALDGGVIDLSGVEMIHVPKSSRDRLSFIATGSGSEILLGGLKHIESGYRTDFLLTDAAKMVLGNLMPGPYVELKLTGTENRLEVVENISLSVGGKVLMGEESEVVIGKDLLMSSYCDSQSTCEITAGAGTHVTVGRSVYYDTQEESMFNLSNASTTLAGGDVHVLEIGGLDVGTAAFILADDNFALGQLTVGETGSPTTSHLLDLADNGNRGGNPEALYLNMDGELTGDGLVIAEGSTLVLHGLNVYAWEDDALVHINSLFGAGENEISYSGGTILLDAVAAAGDLSFDGTVDDWDIDLMFRAMHGGSMHGFIDLDGSTAVDEADLMMLFDLLGTGYADFNLDGVVNISDLDIFGQNYKQAAGWAGGDCNGDGAATLLDLDCIGGYWRMDWRAGVSGETAVPEPGVGLVLLAFAGVGIMRRR